MATIIELNENTADGLVVMYPKTVAAAVEETADKQFMSSSQKTKIDSVETGAEVNAITGIKVNGVLQTITDKVVEIVVTDGDFIPTSAKGVAGGVATLGTDGFIPSSQLPSYVDDVIEVDDFVSLPTTGETGKIYVTLNDNKTYRWSGSTYVEISSSLVLGETTGTAYDGAKGAANASAITALLTRATAIETKNSTQDTAISGNSEAIEDIEDGTTKVGAAEEADKLATLVTVSLTGDVIGSLSTDFSAAAAIPVLLKDTGTAGTYSVVETDAKGRVVAGGQILEVGTSTATEASSSLAVGGLFLKYISES